MLDGKIGRPMNAVARSAPEILFLSTTILQLNRDLEQCRYGIDVSTRIAMTNALLAESIHGVLQVLICQVVAGSEDGLPTHAPSSDRCTARESRSPPWILILIGSQKRQQYGWMDR
jgi:hypothetical protein